MSEEPTTAAVQRYLNALAEDSPAESIIRMLMERAATRARRRLSARERATGLAGSRALAVFPSLSRGHAPWP